MPRKVRGTILYIRSLRGQWKTQENVSNWQMDREALKSKKVPRPGEEKVGSSDLESGIGPFIRVTLMLLIKETIFSSKCFFLGVYICLMEKSSHYNCSYVYLYISSSIYNIFCSFCPSPFIFSVSFQLLSLACSFPSPLLFAMGKCILLFVFLLLFLIISHSQFKTN